LFLAGWVHRDISTGNIIVVENNGCIRGFLSDLEYAKAMNNESASSDPKTVCLDVEDRSCLTFDQGTPYFMPYEIHSGRRCANISTDTQFDEEGEQYLDSILFRPPDLRKTIVRYNYNHDPESLMWVALYIVFGLVDWKAAKDIWPNIFTNSLHPSPDREYFFETTLNLHFYGAFHPGLGDSFPRSFELIRKSLLGICNQSKPEDKNFHDLFNRLILAFDNLLAIVDGKPDIVPFVERSGQTNVEVGTSQSATAKRKMENTDEADIMRVRTTPPVKRARSSTSKAEGKTAGKTAGKAKAKKQ